MKIQLAVFDLAGTTVKDNQDVQRVMRSAMAKYDVHITLQEAGSVMGIPKPLAIRQLLQQHERWKTIEQVEAIHETFVNDMIDFYRNDPDVGEKEGVRETFKILRESNIKVAVNTGFDRVITDVLLERLGWVHDGLIDASVTSDEVLRGRPFPDMIFHLMRLTGVNDAGYVAKIGDTIADLKEGNAARCGLVIGVTTGAFPMDVLQQEEHTHLIATVPQLIPILSLYRSLTIA